MEKFKVKRKHLAGNIADFPKWVVQAMVDEQVRQGNPADPRVFARERTACKEKGGFTWIESALGDSWADIIWGKKFHLILNREKPRCPDSAPRTITVGCHTFPEPVIDVKALPIGTAYWYIKNMTEVVRETWSGELQDKYRLIDGLIYPSKYDAATAAAAIEAIRKGYF